MRRYRYFVLPALCLALLLAAFGFAPALAQAEGGNVYPLTQGWYQGQSTYYYSFDNAVPSSDGGMTVDAAPIYVLFHMNGNPVAGQYNIVDVVPGEMGYSDLWQVHKVTVPNDYVANTAKSYQDLVNAAYPITPTMIYVNCPIVPAGSTLEYSQQALTQGWDDGNPVYYFDFGPNLVDTAPIYVFFYGDDTMVPGQRNVIDDIPGDTDYSAFWRVHKVTVPNNYVPNSATSYADIMTAGFPVTPTSILVNCPVVRTEDAPQVFDTTSGWYRDATISYYSFSNPVPTSDGGSTVDAAPIYVLFYGDGTPVAGQRNIVDVVPGDTGYSDLWNVQKVTVPNDYVPDSIRSYAQIVDGGYPVTPTTIFVNCPVVPEGSSLTGGEVGLTAGWYQGQDVYYFDFGMNQEATAPIYVLFYSDMSPVMGQDNIIDTVPGLPDYSAFWQVHVVTVPNDYVPNSVTSVAGIMSAGFPVQATDMLVNCPVIMSPTSVSLTGFSGGSGDTAVGLALALLAVVAAVAVFVFVRRRRVADDVV